MSEFLEPSENAIDGGCGSLPRSAKTMECFPSISLLNVSNDLARVTSTAIQMVFGDTVAIAMMEARKPTREEYSANHHAGRIGKSLILKV
ncbi:hypothetical protein QQ045_006259 [Rhodiola kirilowii]